MHYVSLESFYKDKLCGLAKIEQVLLHKSVKIEKNNTFFFF